jgi:hypothetical protein
MALRIGTRIAKLHGMVDLYATCCLTVTSTGEASCAQGLGDIPVSHIKLAISNGRQVDHAPQYVYPIFLLPQKLRHPPIDLNTTDGIHAAIQEEDVPGASILDETTNILLSLSL